MDCFAVSIASGIILKRLQWRTFLTMATLFGLFQGGMPLIGWTLTLWASHHTAAYDHWIAFVLLSFVGGKMIYEHFHSDAPAPTFTPTRLAVILTLALATSIDALAIGISFACLGLTDMYTVFTHILVIGIVSFIFSLLGSILGATMGKRLNLNAELWGGLLLIAIGTKILVEHLWG